MRVDSDLAVQGARKQVVLGTGNFGLPYQSPFFISVLNQFKLVYIFQSKRYRTRKHQSVIWHK